MDRKKSSFLLALLLLLALAGCGAEDTPAPVVVVVTAEPPQPVITVVVTSPPSQGEAPTQAPLPTEAAPPPPAGDTGIEVNAATFAHGLSDQMQPVDPGSDFGPAETVYLSVEVKGRPKGGLVTARFFWRETLIAEADVDLADLNSGLLFSIGENTYVGYTLTHEQAFPLSDRYRADLLYDGQPLGSYSFRVVPPPEAIPSKVTEVTLARDADENYNPIDPTTTFSYDQEVHLVGEADLGIGTWIQADWYVAGTLDEAGTRSLTLDENINAAGFVFSYLPEGGWPVGEHYVVLTMNDEEVSRHPFTITGE